MRPMRTRMHKEEIVMRLGWMEILLIVVVVLLIFGPSKLAGVGKALGKSIKDFKSEVKGDAAAEEKKDDVDAE